MVCAAYNADFDGDQMAVHIPLSNEAQMETKLLMLSPNNIFSPANGKPLCTPTQDMILGCYFLTYWNKKNDNVDTSKLRIYNDVNEVLWGMDAELCGLHDLIRLRNPDLGKKTIWGCAKEKYIVTTPGRCIFWEVWPVSLGFVKKCAKI